MMTMMIAATLAAAAPAAPAQPMDAHAEHMQMSGHEHPGQTADMKDCCCKDMDKMHDGDAAHQDHVQQ